MSHTSSGRWRGHVILITGASAGIGAALAERFVSEGARVALAARRLERLEALAARLNGGDDVSSDDVSSDDASSDDMRVALPVLCDVTDPESVTRCVAEVIEHWGQLDVVIANAGFGVAGKLEKLEPADYQRQFDTNVFGVINTLKASLSHLSARQGRAVIVGSVNGHVALNGNSPYAMSKFAVRALAQSLWVEWARHQVSVTLIEPGFVDSEIRKVNNRGVYREHAKDPVPAWLMMPAPQAAKKISHAIFKRRRDQVITGHGKVIVWLARHWPWLMHQILKRVQGRPDPKV